MKYVRFFNNKEVKHGVIEGDRVRVLDGPFLDPLSKPTETLVSLNEVTLLAPVEPNKVLCVGLNYALHAKELEHSLPDDPVIFMKPQTSVIGPDAEIIYPKISQRVDYEAELAVVIGKTIKNVPETDALEAIFGYTCANDVTARDLQKKDGQWTRGKSFDTFCPLGPWVVTGIDPSHLDVQGLLNGEVKQTSNTQYLINSVPKLISFISQVMTLNPGDVVLTGTPEGVGPMQPGDEVVVRIPMIGELRNTVGVQA
ncbi:2-keto-4-pentenoate hydratase/2-oxohepta-3-ene-1,7-dioic acid hydratase [Desulfosporosinus orientis DSM 765]|uniref:2-keto-4-pentenoate hydratase/2-oxohepta-3-ene-1,7-dioic acid hydratase n=1 Tax=Desulfosporosinus orientis (strain ATCC 19365 / DSM 765 / NCIMB 8382 / VKM B-1628 / Singapore I) TaxID=768706 RepID=G7WFP0_DESOD|nr:fumarylacetoacetate hydrolase family protein [Desulfosporosinus orientis]AET68913.1 2-keto-4-pentenoate hydratase/2-oxohepta-3-ene-1,7-dioic acid hydratase [Desulfosporosinus orientis DSM 765]